MTESGDTDPSVPKQMQQNEPNPTGRGGDRDAEAGEQSLAATGAADEGAAEVEDDDFVDDLESDPARAGSDSPGEDLLGG